MSDAEEAIKKAEAWFRSRPSKDAFTDIEAEHAERDDVLIELLEMLAPSVAEMADERERAVGYWYA